MNLTTLKSWLSNVIHRAVKPVRRRVSQRRGNWGCETELMEERSLLSAVGGLEVEAPTAVEIASTHHRKASFSFPNVAGQWNVSGNGLTGVATLTQNKAKVTAEINMSGFVVRVKGKFTRSSPYTLNGSTKVANPMGGGKVKVEATIQFPQTENPTTFDGSVSAAGLDIPVSGTKV